MERAFKCDVCSDKFVSQPKLNLHVLREHGKPVVLPKKRFACNVCGKKCTQNGDLIKHMRTHTREQPFKCTALDCGKAFAVSGNLKTHMRTHTGERPFKCKFSDCGMAFKTESNLTDHINYKHSSERRFNCDFAGCLRTFKTSSGLSKHKKLHSEERPFACTQSGCNYRAKRKDDLSKHATNVHNESKKLTCSKCKYSTNKASHLSRHMIVHEGTNEKIPCSIDGCQYKGKNSEALKQHMRLHKTSLPCPVSGCGRYLRTKKALMEHVKLHNSEGRAFQCPLCFKHFRTMENLQEHCFVHTKEKPFQCGHCDLEAARRGDVKTHISSVHAGTEFPFIVHLLDDRECLCCKVTLPSAEFLEHCKGHVSHSVTK